MPNVRLTSSFVAGASYAGALANGEVPASSDRVTYWDSIRSGFGLVITRKEHKSYLVQYRHGGRVKRVVISGKLDLAAAEKEAKALQGDIARGKDPQAERRKVQASTSQTLQAVAEDYLAKEGGNLRALERRKGTFANHVYPRLGSRPMADIRRSEVVALLNAVSEDDGPEAARTTLVAIRRLCNWYAARTDEYRSPITPGLFSVASKPRQRVLTDPEIRAVWRTAAEHTGPFDFYIQHLLLTAARRSEASDMQWPEVQGGDWIIPGERYKTGKPHLVPLCARARCLLEWLPKREDCQWVFSTDGQTPISGFSKLKGAFDKRCGLSDWRLHDLRRTARTLLSRAGIPSDIAERCLGHAIGGVRAHYDCWQYRDAKAAAFEALASLLDRILNPQSNVVALRTA